jgi:hypothetical protein
MRYATAQEENLDLVRYTLSNYMEAIEDAISDLLPGGREIEMIASPLTEGTQLTRAQAWQLATGNQPWMTVEEVRESEGLPPQEMPDMAQDMADMMKAPAGNAPAEQAAVDSTMGMMPT